MQCISCDNRIPDDSTYCPRCGASQQRTGEKATEGQTLPLPGTGSYSTFSPSPARKKTSGFAVASLVMGIGSYVCIPLIMPVLAIIFGLLAKREIRKSKGQMEGSGLATAGLVLGIVALAIMIAISAVIIPIGLSHVGKTRTITRTVEKMGASEVAADVDMKNGNLTMNGGSSALLKGTFTYNVEGWKPEITYNPGETKSTLSVIQPGIFGLMAFWNTRNDWELSLSNDIPLDMTVHRGSGNSRCNLESLMVNNFKISSTSGNVKVNLAGSKPSLENVKANLVSGNLNIDMTGDYLSQVELSTDTISGNTSIDLRGRWQADLHGIISATSGNISVYLPADVGVYITADVVSGKVSATGLEIADRGNNKTFTNSEYGNSKTTIRLEIDDISGNINFYTQEKPELP